MLNNPTHAMIQPYVESGLIRSSTDGDLTIYSYTDQCVYARAWDPVTMACRGLILNNQDQVIARPFEKFFNLGEPSCPTPPDLPYNLHEKMDGSLIIAYYYRGAWRFATRGSLSNIYTEYAEKFAGRFSKLPSDYTHLFEVILPKGEDTLGRPVRHEPGLYILGSVYTDTGDDVGNKYLREWPGLYPSVMYGPTFTIESALKRAETEEGTEGWVVRYENGFRMKIKTAWYLRVFRAITQMTEPKFRELLAENNVDYDAVLATIPEELRPEAEQIIDKIAQEFETKCTRVAVDLWRARKLFPKAATDREQRKQFAAHIKDHPNRGYLFALLEGKDIVRDLILKG